MPVFYEWNMLYFCKLKPRFSLYCWPGNIDLQVLPGFSLALGFFYKSDLCVQGKKKGALKIKSVVPAFKHIPE
jgi:hypothetical protein